MMSCLECDLPELLEETRPPDPEFVDLIDQAFLEGQIDRQRADLAYLWIQATRLICLGQREINEGGFVVLAVYRIHYYF